MKRHIFVGAYGFFILIGGLFIIHNNAEGAKVSVGNKDYKAIIANNQAAQVKGLSGRDSIGADQAMVFVFSRSGTQCMWMKDMRFSIDIVWVNDFNRIVHIERNVAPSTYPDSFCPPASAKYVIETNAFATKKARKGDIVHIHY